MKETQLMSRTNGEQCTHRKHVKLTHALKVSQISIQKTTVQLPDNVVMILLALKSTFKLNNLTFQYVVLYLSQSQSN